MPRPPSANDTLHYEGASRLAVRITQYWNERGYPGIRTKVEEIPGAIYDSHTIYVVRSNMIGGLPPQRAH